jgi:hypothetical protein
MKYYKFEPAQPRNTEFKVNFAKPEVQEIPCTVISTLGEKSFIKYPDNTEGTIYRWVKSELIVTKDEQ